MKELSIEEKAKRYDKAFIKSREFLTLCEKCGAKDTVEFIEDIFPELKMDKESEDERIRKELIEYINRLKTTTISDLKEHQYNSWISWLEKQGKKSISFTFDDVLALQCCMETVKKVQEDKDLYEKLNDLHGRVYDAYHLEKQGEQKPADKIEPKFKVGDWCIDNEDDTVFQIVKVLDKTYRYRTNKGKEYSCAHYSLELDARVWNMSDAKEGDVLVDSLGNICIYQEPSTKLMYHSHCYGNHKFFIPMGGSHEIVGSYPASKEQRDKLEKSMADAGYVFDFEKKELKKIEQKPPIVNFKARDWYVDKVDGKIYNAKFMEEPLTNQKRRLEIEKAAMSATGIIEQEEWFIKGAEWSDKNPYYISYEKQGEQKSFDYENVNIQQKDFAPKSAMEAINEQKGDNANKVELNDYSSIDPHFGKPIDKIEPKFKVGDYVVDNCGYVWRIEGIINQFYILEGIDGGESRPTIEWVNKTFHLWDITDAKDGDILHSTGFHNDCIFIFNGLDNWKFDEPNGDRAVATGYCCLSVSADNMEFGMQGPDCVEVNTVKPATKIQRDLLFRKIKEAGYEWDAEKKELKKIEHKPTWSEEDESNFQMLIDVIKENKHHATDYEHMKYYKLLSWFKSLKDRYVWKPSDEQMKALDWALSLAKNCGDECAFDLRTLQEQLKKI